MSRGCKDKRHRPPAPPLLPCTPVCTSTAHAGSAAERAGPLAAFYACARLALPAGTDQQGQPRSASHHLPPGAGAWPGNMAAASRSPAPACGASCAAAATAAHDGGLRGRDARQCAAGGAGAAAEAARPGHRCVGGGAQSLGRSCRDPDLAAWGHLRFRCHHGCRCAGGAACHQDQTLAVWPGAGGCAVCWQPHCQAGAGAGQQCSHQRGRSSGGGRAC